MVVKIMKTNINAHVLVLVCFFFQLNLFVCVTFPSKSLMEHGEEAEMSTFC